VACGLALSDVFSTAFTAKATASIVATLSTCEALD
jgi:hypothetical protein